MALTKENALVMELCLSTGIRLSDALALQTEKVKNANQRRLTIKEMKTGKSKRIIIPAELHMRMLQQAGRFYIFEHRTDQKRHRTRQAVWKDVARAAKAFRLEGVIAPHTARKVWAVSELARTNDIEKVKKGMNHSSSSVTALYALANALEGRKSPKGAKRS
jgi:site-specific recombinase XerD